MLRSPPSRRRGLKFKDRNIKRHTEESPPSRRRGLKSKCVCVSAYFTVASFAEAWIEITPGGGVCPELLVASFAEAWIEILFCFTS